MFEISTSSDVARRFVSNFYEEFTRGAVTSNQKLSTPGGPFEAKIYYREDLDIWAHIDRELYNSRYSLWFGAGAPHWRPAIEINVPTALNLHQSGQLVVDEDGKAHLAHRGGLGGGKYSVGVDVFADLIRNFIRDDVKVRHYIKEYFIIGSLDAPDMMVRLADYVKEARRIRVLRENETKFAEALQRVGGSFKDGNAVGGELKLENADSVEYIINRRVAFEKIHAKVHKKLASELKKRKLDIGNSRLDGGIGPDLYTIRSKTMSSLFEIKVGIDSQSIFTAIGQLIVYSSGQNGAKKYLVSRGMPRSSLFAQAMMSEGIINIFYELVEDEVIFKAEDLDCLM